MNLVQPEPRERGSALGFLHVPVIKHKERTMSGPIVTQVWDYRNFHQYLVTAFPQSTEQHVSSITGIPASTVKKHYRGECRPCADHMIVYISAFGAGFLAAVMKRPPTSIVKAARDERIKFLEQQSREINVQICGLR